MIDDVGLPLPNDGLRLWNPGYVGSFGFPSNRGALDIWTGDNNTTHMRFDGGGAIHTQNNRMEIIGKRNGLWLNAAPDFNFPAINARIFFNIGTVAGGGDEYGRFSNDGTGNNIGFMRIGVQPVPATPIDADRRLEVFDAANLPQFRITQTAGTNFADFQVTNLGDLSIFPWAGTNNRRVGINTTAPQNTLDINANGNYVATAPNSGLRLRDMRSGSTTTASNGKVLSVDANGDVILVDDIGGGNISSSCGTLAINYINKVTGGSTICTSGIYEDAALNVGIGTASPLSKLHVNRSITTGNYASGTIVDFASTSASLINGYGMYVTSSVSSASGYNSGINSIVNGGNTCYGFIADVNNTNTSGATNVGAHLYAKGVGNSTNNAIVAYAVPTTTGSSTVNRGVDIHVGHNAITATTNNAIEIYTQNANNNTGITMQVVPTTTTATNNTGINCLVGTSTAGIAANDVKGVYVYSRGGSGVNYGVEAGAGMAPTSTTFTTANIGGKFHASGGSFTYGVYVTATGSNCTATTTTGCPIAAGYFAGDVVTTANYNPSDIHLKTNIQNVSNGLSIINQLQPKTYNYDTAQYSYMNLHGDLQYGLVAQDLIPVLPQCLKNLGLPQESDSTGKIIHPEVNYLGVNYTMIIPILIAGMKEQQLQIDSLINAIAAGNQPKIANPNTIEVTLSNQNKIILNQNDPNPFAENTTINYFITDNVNAAQLLFYDNNGTILKTVDIKEKGKGSILIYGSNLSSGVYSYTLLADGKPVETKRMVKIK